MKKKLLSLFLIFTTFSLFAELHKPGRYFEIGFDTYTGTSNNYFGITDVLVEDLVIDLNKIASEISDSGLNLEFNTTENVYLNLNINPMFRLGFFSEVDANVSALIGNDLFNLIGKGTKIGESMKINLGSHGDAFVAGGISFRTLISGFGVKIVPAYYVPVFHLDDVEGYVKWVNDKDGTIKADVKVPVRAYAALNIEDTKNIEADPSEILNNGGFDLSFEVEHPIFYGLDVGVFGRIPMAPGKLGYSIEMDGWASFYEKNLLGMVTGDEDHDFDYGGFDDIKYGKKVKKVFRPFKLGGEASFKVLRGLFELDGSLNIAVRNPYSKDAVFYPEYSADFIFNLGNIFRLNAGTAYQNEVFMQKVGFDLNARLVEFDFKACLRGGDFANSFKITGLGVYAGVKMGF